MARVTRLELATSGVTGRRSNQLSYTPAKQITLSKRFNLIKTTVGCCQDRPFAIFIKTTCKEQANLMRVMVGGEGFEPPTYWV
jgi:hypothetical protein